MEDCQEVVACSTADDEVEEVEIKEEEEDGQDNGNKLLKSSPKCKDGLKPYGCPECDKSFVHKSDMRRHLLTHTGTKPFLCPDCGDEFFRKDDMIRHARTHKGDKPFVCNQCGALFNRKDALARHVNTHTGNIRPFSCALCNRKYCDQQRLAIHMKSHVSGESEGNEEDFEVQVVADESLIQEALASAMQDDDESVVTEYQLVYLASTHDAQQQEHGKTPDDFKPYSCPECNKAFMNKGDMLRHQRSHTDEKLFSCSECERKFHRKDDMERHYQGHMGGKPFSCPDCGCSFSRKYDMMRHLQTHRGYKPFECTICQRKFSRRPDMIAHTKNHYKTKPKGKRPYHRKVITQDAQGDIAEGRQSESGQELSKEDGVSGSGGNVVKNTEHETPGSNLAEDPTSRRPFVVSLSPMVVLDEEDLASMAGTSKGALKNSDESKQPEPSQSTYSSGEGKSKNFVCSQCPKEFTRKGDMIRHQRSHSGEKPHTCVRCGHGFARNTDLVRHIRSHMTHRPFCCGKCFVTFTRKDDLTRHLRIHRGIKPFSCFICERTFSRRFDMTKHMAIHSKAAVKGRRMQLRRRARKIAEKSGDRDPDFGTNDDDGLDSQSNRNSSSDSEADNPHYDIGSIIDELKQQKQRFSSRRGRPRNVMKRGIRSGETNANDNESDCRVANESEVLKASEQDQHSLLAAALKGKYTKTGSSSAEQERTDQDADKPLQCPQCNKGFIHKFDFHRHLQTHTNEKPFTCQQCGGNFRRKDDMFRHQRKHLHATAFSCHKCNAQFSRKFDLNRHLKLHDLGPVCKFCGGEFSEFSDLYKHIISHAEVKLKKLDLSNSQMFDLGSVAEDVSPKPPESRSTEPLIIKAVPEKRKADSEKVVPEPVPEPEPTPKPTRIRRGRGRPRLPGNEKRPYKKKKKIVKEQVDDIGDQIEWGDNTEGAESAPAGRVRRKSKLKENVTFECWECEKSFTHKADLQRHLRTHSSDKPFSCPQCGDDFRRKADMVRHLRTHMGEKPFGCPECCDEFTRKDDMVRHLRTHQGVKPFACLHCDKRFSRRPDMYKHMVTHASMKVKHSICRKCGFLKMDNDDSHQHTDDDDMQDMMEGTRRKKKLCRDFVYHQCKICKQPFKRKRELTVHLKSHSLVDIVNIPKPNVTVTSVLKQDEQTIETTIPNEKAVHEVCTIVYQPAQGTDQVQYADAITVQEYDFVLISNTTVEEADQVPKHSASETDEKLPSTSRLEIDESKANNHHKTVVKVQAVKSTKESAIQVDVSELTRESASHSSDSADQATCIVKCSHCGRPFTHNEAMNKHMQTHSGSKASCETCTKNFGQKIEYKMHCDIESIDLYACKSQGDEPEVIAAE